jgi:putative ABC transport system substrate-binding protein
VHLRVDVIVSSYTPLVRAAMQATNTIPIVFAGDTDPVAGGLVASLAKPGGNVTGISLMSAQVGAKRVELVTQLVPGIARLAVLDDPAAPGVVLEVSSLRDAAEALGLPALDLKIGTPDDLESAFQAALRDGAGALAVPSTAFFSTQRSQIVDLAGKYRLPAIYPIREYVDEGGLMAYGTNRRDDFRHAASYVDKILRGAKPADLPVEQPTVYELVVNLKTLQALGLTIPSDVAAQVTEWIQ